MKQDNEWLPGQHDLDYIESISPPILPAAVALEAGAERQDVPIVDRAIGRLLHLLATGRRRILEIGTAYGYSTLWLALGQPGDGRILTIDPDSSRTKEARRYWRQAGIDDGRIQIVNSPALAFLTANQDLGAFDLVFLDALKPEYGAYVEAVIPLLRNGSLLIADNALLSGRVSGARPPFADTRSTDALASFNEWMLAHDRFRAQILPVGDGLLVSVYVADDQAPSPDSVGITDARPKGAAQWT